MDDLFHIFRNGGTTLRLISSFHFLKFKSGSFVTLFDGENRRRALNGCDYLGVFGFVSANKENQRCRVPAKRHPPLYLKKYIYEYFLWSEIKICLIGLFEIVKILRNECFAIDRYWLEIKWNFQ